MSKGLVLAVAATLTAVFVSGCNSSNEEDAKLLAAQAERAEAEIGKLAKDKEQLAQEVEKWKKDVVSLRILSENRGRENEHLNSQVLKLARDTEDLEKEIEQAKGEKAKLREQAAHQVAQLKQEIVHLENEQLREENETADALAKKAARMVAAQVREQVEAYKASDANQSPATVPVAVPVAVPVGVPVGVPATCATDPFGLVPVDRRTVSQSPNPARTKAAGSTIGSRMAASSPNIGSQMQRFPEQELLATRGGAFSGIIAACG